VPSPLKPAAGPVVESSRDTEQREEQDADVSPEEDARIEALAKQFAAQEKQRELEQHSAVN
jgi:hypothetical protein